MQSKRLMFMSGQPVPDKAKPIERTGKVALLYMEQDSKVTLLCHLPSVYIFPRATVFAVRRLTLKRALKNSGCLKPITDLHSQHRLIAIYLPLNNEEAFLQQFLEQVNGPCTPWNAPAGTSRGVIEL